MALISFSNLVFSHNTFALYTPTLSASVDNSDVTVSGNDVLRFDKTSFNLLTLIVKTNNRTGYTVSISSETNDTSLKNLESTSGAKIESIAEDLPLGDFTANTWGYKMWSENILLSQFLQFLVQSILYRLLKVLAIMRVSLGQLILQ